MKLFAAILILFSAHAAQATLHYASTSGSGTACTVISTPCSIYTVATGNSGAIVAGDTVYLRGGTYSGKFNFSLSGSSGNPITVRSYPGEWAVIDGYATTTLNGGINNSTTTVVVTSAAKMFAGMELTFHDGTEGTEENIKINSMVGNTLTVSRGWNGMIAVSHSNGATIVLGGHTLAIGGSEVWFRDLEVTNTDTARVQANADSQNNGHLRGGIDVTGTNIKLINMSIHDQIVGVGGPLAGTGLEVYGCVVYNNGYVAAGVYNGHGFYLQNESSTLKQVNESISFNNFAIGIKGESQNANAQAIHLTGDVSVNNGSPSGDTTRRQQILLGANNGTATDFIIDACYSFCPTNTSGGIVKFDCVDDTSTVQLKNTWQSAGRDGVSVHQVGNLTLTGNRVYIANASGPYLQLWEAMPGGASYTVSGNAYYNSTGNATVFCRNGSCGNFATWQGLGLDTSGSSNTNTAPPSNWVAVRANVYDSNRVNAVVYNWTGASTQALDVSGVFSNGDSIAVHRAEQGTWPNGTPSQTLTVSGGSITVSMAASGSVIAPVGADQSVIFTPATVFPTFGAFILVRTAQASGGGSTSSGAVKKSGNLKQ